MTRSLLHIDTAACAHHDGDQGRHRAIAALTALQDGYRTGLATAASRTYGATSAQDHHERAVREPRDILAA
ncbi:hypothetical protein [Streptomyces tibetensis]|uniref:hypothetical protein n=1 Tax=Streptomyces tibetensis TaxID=2382123 RepID=UPI003405BB48